MKILCEFAPCGPSYVRSGWGRVFASLGHDFIFWDPSRKAALDIFAEVEPDLFIGTTYGVTRAIAKAIAARPAMRVVLYASAWGPLADEIPESYPITRVTEAEKVAIATLKKRTGRPDFVFSHVGPTYEAALLGGWLNHANIPHLGILNAADTFLFPAGRVRPELLCDVGFIGGWWDYKARNLGPALLPLCHAETSLRVKIFGNQPWPVAQYLGQLPEHLVSDLFVSATVCPNVSEPHSTEWGYDVVERPFKVLAAGGFCVSDAVADMTRIFGDSVPLASSHRELHEMVRHYVAHPEERRVFIGKGQRLVLEEHTYFHRVSQMLHGLAMYEESNRCMELHRKLVLGG